MACYLTILIVYSVLIQISSWADREHKEHLGWTNSAIIGLTDLLLIGWGTFSMQGIFLSPFKSSLTLLVTRIAISFNPTYWIITHSVIFLIIQTLFVTSWTWKSFPVQSSFVGKRQKAKIDIFKAVSKCPTLKKDMIDAKVISQESME